MDQDKLQSNDYIYFFKKLPGDQKVNYINRIMIILSYFDSVF